MRVVFDDSNTHHTASLDETFPAAKARWITKRLRVHYSSMHGSWLNISEIEFDLLCRSCLKQRLHDEVIALRREIHTPIHERSAV